LKKKQNTRASENGKEREKKKKKKKKKKKIRKITIWGGDVERGVAPTK
jgi:hypothetical protein